MKLQEFLGVGYFDMKVPGALTAGTRVRKVNSEQSDTNPNGTLGIVMGSVQVPGDERLAYFVAWDFHAGVARRGDGVKGGGAAMTTSDHVRAQLLLRELKRDRRRLWLMGVPLLALCASMVPLCLWWALEASREDRWGFVLVQLGALALNGQTFSKQLVSFRRAQHELDACQKRLEACL